MWRTQIVMFSLACRVRGSETTPHTEWKSVENPSVLLNVFTRKLGQQFWDNQLSVFLPLGLVPIGHIQNKSALEAGEKTRWIKYHL